MRSLIANLLALSLATGCVLSTTSYTAHYVPLETSLGDAAKHCTEECEGAFVLNLDTDAYARCLATCPGHVRRKGTKCRPDEVPPRAVCFTHERESVSIGRSVGAFAVWSVLATFGLFLLLGAGLS